MRREQRTQVAGSAWLACMTHAINIRRWLSAGKARYEPEVQVSGSVRPP